MISALRICCLPADCCPYSSGKRRSPTSSAPLASRGIGQRCVGCPASLGAEDLQTVRPSHSATRLNVTFRWFAWSVATVNKTDAVRILLVDDDPRVQRGLEGALGADVRLDVVGSASSVHSSIEAARALEPDVVVMDLRLPDGSGVEATRAIRDARAPTRVVIHTTVEGGEALMATLLAGAAGYIIKDLHIAPMIEAILAASEGRSLLDEAATERASAEILRFASKVEPTVPSPIARGAFRVTRALVEGRTDAEIATLLGRSESSVRRYALSLFTEWSAARRV